MKGIIYKATNLYNGLSYIGQTRATLEKRRSQHLKDAVTDSVNHFHLALMQYGDSGFKWEILDEFSGSKEEVIHALNVAEEYHILRLKTRLSEYGYNATQGGYSSDKFDDAIKRRALANYGGKAVLQYDLDGNFVREYESIAEVCRVFGIKNKHKGCYFLGRKWKGYQWREKVNEYFKHSIEPARSYSQKTTRVVAYNSDGCIYKVYPSIKACYNDLGKQYRIRKDFSDASYRVKSAPDYLVFKCEDDTPPASIDITVIHPQKEEKDKNSIEQSIPVLQYDLNGKLIREFASIAEAHRVTGASACRISKSCKKAIPFRISNGVKFIWRRKDGEIKHTIEVDKRTSCSSKNTGKHRKEHRVLQYGANGEFIKEWKNAYFAAISVGCSDSAIRRSLRGHILSKDTYIWKKYYEDYPQKINISVAAQEKKKRILTRDTNKREKPKTELRGLQRNNKGYEPKMEHRVLQCDNNGDVIKVWENMYQASLQTGESHNLIRKQCMGIPTRKKTPSVWRYYA